MDKYYFYIEKERTRVFSDKSNGKPLEFNIEGINTSELYNTFRYDTVLDECVICPLKRSYEQGYDNIYNFKTSIGGRQGLMINAFLETNHVFDIINLLNTNEGEIRIIYSFSFLKNQIENSTGLSNDYYNYAINQMNTLQKSNFVFKGTYYAIYLVDGLFYFLVLNSHNNLLYIDEKLAICDYNKEYNRSCAWGVNNPILEKEWDDYFIDYLKKESLYDDESDFENIKSYVLHEAKKGNDVSKITINRRDEKLEIDCKLLKEYLEKNEEQKYKELSEFLLSQKLVNEKTVCLLNMHNRATKEKVGKMINDMNIRIYSKDNYFSILLKFCEVVDKYNSPMYRPRIILMAKKQRTTSDKLLFDGKYYNVQHLFSSKKEEKVVCDFLGLDK